LEISNPKIVKYISGIPFSDMEEVLEALGRLFSKGFDGSELIKTLKAEMEDERSFCGVYNLAGRYDDATNIIIEVRRQDSGLYLLALSCKQDKDVEKRLAEEIKRDRALRFVELSFDIATCGNRVVLDCEEIMSKLKEIDVFASSNICAEELAAGLMTYNGDFGVPFVPVLSDGSHTVLFTLEDVPSTVSAVFFGGTEGWRREGTVFSIPLHSDMEKGGFKQPKMKFFILRYHIGDPSQRPPFIQKEEMLEADHRAQSILECLIQGDKRVL